MGQHSFQEVMKQWRRMCDKHTCSRNKDAFTELPICPIAVTHEGYPCDEDPIDWTEEATKQLEEIVMQWAAEHPEPVYTTWVEYLVGIGVIPHEIQLETADALMDTHLLKPIPADIAEKLGLEPR